MQIGLVGLGRMGANMARRLMQGRSHVRGDGPAAPTRLRRWRATARRAPASLEALVAALAHAARRVGDGAGRRGHRTHGRDAGRRCCRPGDIVIDGGNSWFKDDVRRGAALGARGIRYVDAGTSGGVWGADRGYCLMVGGDTGGGGAHRADLRALAPGESGIAPSRGRDGKASTAHLGYLHCGPVGRGPLREDDSQRHRVRA